jgi:hypothetical protein
MYNEISTVAEVLSVVTPCDMVRGFQRVGGMYA